MTGLRFDDSPVTHHQGLIRGSVFGTTTCDLDYVDPGVVSLWAATARVVSDPVDCMSCLVRMVAP